MTRSERILAATEAIVAFEPEYSAVTRYSTQLDPAEPSYPDRWWR